MTWDQLTAAFSANIESDYQRARIWLSEALAFLPEDVKRRVALTLSALKATGRTLARAQGLLPARPTTQAEAALVVRYAELASLYRALLQGLALNAEQIEAEPEVEAGFIPATVVLTIGALGLTAAGVAWALAAWQYASGLRDHAAFLLKELEARQEAMRSGQALPPSSAHAAPNKDKPAEKKSDWGWLWAVLGMSTLAGAAVFGPTLFKK